MGRKRGRFWLSTKRKPLTAIKKALSEMVSLSPQMFSQRSLERLGHSVEGLVRPSDSVILFPILLPSHQVILMIGNCFAPSIFLS